ncbi:MAG TPA: efflux RND transporter permease subunit [Candidatus Dormibacteraeota bacterium]|nr:efflux RND transporter permease subunit [Candidatus Dormibacteraeota bacterium]
MIRFFLNRPIFATVCALMITLAGAVMIPTLPIAQYPQVAPPVVTVSANWIGASPTAIESAVTVPLEDALNDVEGLRYITSSSADGASTVSCTFTLGTNLDIAAADVQNAVQSALGLLPAQVRQTGVTITKNSGSILVAIALRSNTSKYDTLWLSNYAQLNVVNTLARVSGVSQVRIFGERRYAMRIWLDPRKLAQQGLTVPDVINALSEQNEEVAAGSIGAAPEPSDQPYTYVVNASGRLSAPAQFANIVLRTDPNGGFTRLGDVARIQLGAEDYSSYLRFDGQQNAVGMGVFQYPDANALSVAAAVTKRMKELARHFPAGITYTVALDSTTFVRESVREVLITLMLSVLLVVLVIYLFLQDPRATLIPAATIPVSLVGTFFVMKIFGFTINTITLFGLTLATGLVVDDAIVVIENIARHMERNRGKMSGRDSALEAMREIQSAVVASSLVLLAVFLPVAFFPGTTGEIYRQFALTIAASISISLFAALTFAPTLTARLLHGDIESNAFVFHYFNLGYHAFRDWYARSLPKIANRRTLVLGAFAAALLVTGIMFRTTPTAFIPNEDQGFAIILVQAPEGTSLAYESAFAAKAEHILLSSSDVDHVFNVGGFSFGGSAPNFGLIFVRLKPWSERPGYAHSLDYLLAGWDAQFARIPGGTIIGFDPPAINGIGSFGGFQFELEDQGNVGLPVLAATANAIIAAAYADPRLSRVFTQFRLNSPQIQMHIDRNKAKALGISMTDLFETVGTDLGSYYVNDFDYLNRSWRVYVQADTPFRDRIDALQQLYVAPIVAPGPAPAASSSLASGQTPISNLVTLSQVKTAPVISHYDLFRSLEINGNAAPGHGSGEAIAAIEQIFARVAPAGIGYEWSGLQLDEIAAGSTSTLIFVLGLVVVFLVLSAQYESFIDPLIVILAVPAAIFGALLALDVRHLPQDIYAQVGYVMLIGLASKSAILIVEFANQQMRAGADAVTAALRAAQTRLRPILMTSIAFIIAVLPMVFATGAGSAARHSLGTVVFGGMLLSTFLNLAITPVLYILIKSLSRPRAPADS